MGVHNVLKLFDLKILNVLTLFAGVRTGDGKPASAKFSFGQNTGYQLCGKFSFLHNT